MNVHLTLDQEGRERAALHALGCLEFSEARLFEMHLDECRVCEREVAALRRAAGALPAVVPSAEPPPDLLGRILYRVRDTRPVPPELEFTKSDGGPDWQKLAVEGVDMKTLHVDTVAKRATILVRMAPGTSYPGHRHAGDEDCYVISGSLQVGVLTMHAGDFQRAPAGSRHPVQSTATGCLLFIQTSLHDELEHATA